MMKNDLRLAETGRKQLHETISRLATGEAPAEVKVKDGGHTLAFGFDPETGRCTSPPKTWAWMRNWSYRDAVKYWDAHHVTVLPPQGVAG